MFFHIDESGNTGNNLFDLNQPRLSYGVLSSKMNADVLCSELHKRALEVVDVECLHANVLNLSGLEKISRHLLAIQSKMMFEFDYYYIEKTDFALIAFFDAVFDQGLNEAVPWSLYWTPLRYAMLIKLASIFDNELLKRSWELCLAKRIERHKSDIVDLLAEVRRRSESSSIDERGKELIRDALDFGIAHPLSLDFGFPDQKMMSPNAIGFQFVVSAVGKRLLRKRARKPNSIIIDKQQQFNSSQVKTYSNISILVQGLKELSSEERRQYFAQPLFSDIYSDAFPYDGFADHPISISDSASSIGLQIVDIYLWLVNRVISHQQLPPGLARLTREFSKRSVVNGISLEGLNERFSNYMASLSKFEDLTAEQRDAAKSLVDMHREKVKGLGI